MMARKRETFDTMPLTLRPTRLSRDPDDQDWTVHDDGAEIGRLYEDLQTNRPENRWFWSITVMGPARGHMRTSARAATLERAKADFQAAWEAFKAANLSS
jgi:hypothetical protein